ncbi:hypothetical protein bcere0016_39620 [Bacillus cereus 95/8201]|uniref:Uncharacterized protein n=3 Tax=Bacillus cereus group TaxID=86661 RepID=A0A243CNW2_BACTU|nr:group-specific protein [Bacillus cereus E33L]EEL15455.1 hypothetical protein bcere0016_39620 [Bacillus cereus 95/8201]OTW48449.1 hypothetical protein BK699_14850 [Bacillus thuringiensis serovar mexicanensis]OTW97459.1 hypothetical protein BK705_26890 [Bacillus thuringiensis serovar monterrey]OTY67621.1 hypothetical protein BK749_28495 [Bacillus thuringiensis serovar vazensis]
MGVAPFLFVIQNDRIYSSWLFYALFYALLTVILMIFYLFLFYILHKNKSADTIQTSNKYSIKLLNIHH